MMRRLLAVGASLAALAFCAAAFYGIVSFGSGWNARDTPLALTQVSELPDELEYVHLTGGAYDTESRRTERVTRRARTGEEVVTYRFVTERYVTSTGSVLTATLGDAPLGRTDVLGVYLPRAHRIVCSLEGSDVALAVRLFLACSVLGLLLCVGAAVVATRGEGHVATRGTEPAQIAHYRELPHAAQAARYELRHTPSPSANAMGLLFVAASCIVPMLVGWSALGEIPGRGSGVIFYPVPLLAASVMAMAFFLNRGTIVVTRGQLARVNPFGATKRTRIDASSEATCRPLTSDPSRPWRVQLGGPGEGFFVARIDNEQSARQLVAWLNASMKKVTSAHRDDEAE